MSLYSDLNEVLTPYANKINDLAASVDQIKDDIDEILDELDGISSLVGSGVVEDDT